MRRYLRWFRAWLLSSTGAIWWAKRCLRRRRAAVVMTFHRVLEDADFAATNSLPGIVVRKRTFEQLAAFVTREYHVIDATRSRPGERISKLPVAFTFDDGWIDNYSTAFPIARKHRIPITIFVCSGLMGLASPFWPERVAAALKARQPRIQEGDIEARIEELKRGTPGAVQAVLAPANGKVTAGLAAADRTFSWEQAAELHYSGVRIGAHTHTHQILTGLPVAAARAEIQQSKTATEDAMRTSCNAFAYPNGDNSAAVRELVAEAGFEVAFGTKPGAWTQDCDRLAIPRMNVAEDSVTGPDGNFSPVMFDYWIIWRAWRATQEVADNAEVNRAKASGCVTSSRSGD
jgi:peptidoglycan/xylan/chitin deacetylase (PgdA/CDA1 family)